jgi:hypothetical protein
VREGAGLRARARASRKRAHAAAAFAVALAVGGPASALPTEERYSDYEQETIDEALSRREGAAIDPAPEGKRIEAIEIDALEVIEGRDPAPDFLNVFHTTSRDYVIRRELLVRRGDRWQSALLSESERNLRGLRQLSLVLIVPLRGSRPDTVRVLVLTKDIWSVRLNTDFRFKSGALEYLLLQPAEENLAGTHRRLLTNFVYKPDTIAFGAGFLDPRLAGSRHAWGATAGLIVNHTSGDLEGSFGALQYGLPLYSTRRKWAWGATVSWRHEISRRFVGTDLAGYDARVSPGNDCAPPATSACIPYVFESDNLSGRYGVTRSFGVETKHDVSIGFAADRSAYRTPDLSAFDPAAVAEFEAEVLPVSETRIGPFVQYHFYQNRFVSMLDVETLGLQESFLVGPNLYARFYPVTAALGSTRDILGNHGELAWTFAPTDALVRPYVAATAEVQPDIGEVTDASVNWGLRVVSPRIYVGRLIFDATVVHRPRNFLNARTALGGDGRLRGYPSGFFLGKDALASNLEFRSRPIQIFTFQLAGALFYDVGDAFDGFDDIEPKQGAGFGLRILFPQLERSVMRIDWGFPLSADAVRQVEASRGTTYSPFEGLVVTFRQGFGVPQPTGTGVAAGSP